MQIFVGLNSCLFLCVFRGVVGFCWELKKKKIILMLTKKKNYSNNPKGHPWEEGGNEV